MALTDKQQRFVQEYLIDLNATQAAIRAGYSVDTARSIGSENLSKPDIQEALAEANRERLASVKIDAAYVLRQATKLHERCMQEVEPLTDRKGDQVYDEAGNPLYVFNAAGAAKALELVGKHVDVGAFKDRVEHTGPDGGAIRTITTHMTAKEAEQAYMDAINGNGG